jgi:hypothetical protein
MEWDDASLRVLATVDNEKYPAENLWIRPSIANTFIHADAAEMSENLLIRAFNSVGLMTVN